MARKTESATPPKGILAIWHDVVPEHAGDTLAWYDTEHHFERLAVPGFRSVRRYHAEQGAPFLFIRYETDHLDVLSSPAYLDRLNRPTPWTLRCQPQFLNNSRTVCSRIERTGAAEGGVAVTIRLDAGHSERSHWQRGMNAAAAVSGILGWEHWAPDLGKSAIPTREKQLRGGEDRYVAGVLLMHARGAEEAEAGLTAFRAAVSPQTAEACQTGTYRLAFTADNFSL